MADSNRPGTNVRRVTSPANSLIKAFRRALAEGTTREGWLAIEGPHGVEEALQAAPFAAVQSLLIAQGAAEKYRRLLDSAPELAEITVIPDRLFQRLSQMEAPPGIAALVELAAPSLDSVLGARNALLLIACGIQDPGNLGAMLRSAQALGATAMLTLKGTVSPLNPKAVRASAGAIFHLPVLAGLEAGEFVHRAHEKGVRIVAAERESASKIAEADLRGPAAFLIGREGSGLGPEISRLADLFLSIPIRPGSDSLNAAIAAGIFLYEAARQRGFEY